MTFSLYDTLANPQGCHIIWEALLHQLSTMFTTLLYVQILPSKLMLIGSNSLSGWQAVSLPHVPSSI